MLALRYKWRSSATNRKPNIEVVFTISGCVKTDCWDEPLCKDMCSSIMHCRTYEWILNNDDNDIFGETWCAVDGYGMCYCCDC